MAEAGKPLRLTANTTDDVQVRVVEFYLDGALVATDGNYPFEVWLTAPALNAQSSFKIRAQVTDTGGNSTTSTEQTVQLVADATPPRLLSVSPINGSFAPPNNVKAVTATFDERLDAAKVNSNSFKLFRAGADGVVGTGDDQPVAGRVTFDNQNNRATFTVNPALPEGRYRAVLEASLTDTANNPLVGGQATWSFSVGVISWDGGGDGSDWHDPANWESDQLPPSGSIVVIKNGVNGAVIYSQGNLSLTQLRSNQPIQLDGGTLTLSGDTTLTAALTVNGGILANNGPFTLNGPFTWNTGTLSGAGTTIAAGGLTISNTGGIALDGHKLENAGSGSWSNIANYSWYFTTGASFTNRAGATFTQQTSEYDQASSDGSAVSILNAGTWVKANATTNYLGLPFNNTGTVNAGILQLSDGTSSGTMAIGGGTTIDIDGVFENQAAGQITGNGTLDVSNGTFTNNGTIAPSVTVVN